MAGGMGLLHGIREARDTGCLRDLGGTVQAASAVRARRRTVGSGGTDADLLPVSVAGAADVGGSPRQADVPEARQAPRRTHPDFPPAAARDAADAWIACKKMTVALTALEARYLPKLDPEFVHLNNDDVEGRSSISQAVRPGTDAGVVAVPIGASWRIADLLHANRIDPVGADWSRLMRRAPGKSRKYLKDAALQAMDLRIAAEILLLFYEDLAGCDQAEPLPNLSASLGWHPLVERLSFRRNTSMKILSPSASRRTRAWSWRSKARPRCSTPRRPNGVGIHGCAGVDTPAQA